MSQTSSAPRFGHDTRALEVVKGVNLKGKNVRITGGGGKGMGVELSRAMASTGANLIIGARDKARGEEAAAKLRKEFDNPSVSVGVMDLGSLKSIKNYV